MPLIIELHHEVIEVKLIQANGGAARGNYIHTQHLDKRREMM
ncbi:integrase [Escherichia coli]|nr:integrase [Escherichia coli]